MMAWIRTILSRPANKLAPARPLSASDLTALERRNLESEALARSLAARLDILERETRHDAYG